MISRNWMIFSKEKWRNVSVHCGPPPHHPTLPCVFLSISFCLLCTPCRNDFHSCWINEVLLNWEKARGVSTHKGTHTCTSRSKLGDTHTHTHTISTAEAIFKSASTLARRQWFTEARTLFGFFKKKKNYFPPFAAQVCFLFSSKLQEMLQRWKCWTTITNKAEPNLRFSQIYMPVYPPVQAVQCTRHTHTHKYESGPRAGPSHHGNTLLCVLNSTVIWGCRTSLPPHIDVGAGFPCSASLSALAEATLRRQRREAVSPARGPISRAPARVWLTYRKRRQWKHVKERAVKRM